MSKVIIATKETIAPTAITDRWKLLFETLKERFGFLFYSMEEIELLTDLKIFKFANDVDTVLLCVSPKQINSNQLLNIIRQNKGVRLITYVIDLHAQGDRFANLLEGSDVILSIDDERFRREYPQFVKKFVFFPLFFAPHDRYTKFSLNEKPVMKCLLSGASTHAYPLRIQLNQIAKRREYSKLFDALPYPGTHGALYPGVMTRDAFAEQLHSYFCVATSTVHQCVISKMFEIPAVGSLLLTNRVKDMDTLGFDPSKHYVPITSENALERISQCLAHPKDYEKIRQEGMDFVHASHSINNRMELFGQVLEGDK